MLVIFSGLPGSGKTTLARELARRTGATYLRIDSIETAMARSSLRLDPVADAGYCAGFAVARDNLRLGRVVIADSINPWHLTRQAWREPARDTGCEYRDVEVICSDAAEHRARIDSRKSDIEGLTLPDWQGVIGRDYQPWTTPRVIIDTAGRDSDDCVDELERRLAKAWPGPYPRLA